MRIVSCLATEHNLWLVALAAIVCVMGSAIAFGLYSRARERIGEQRFGWVFLTGMAVGSSVWCTHFIAMLAYKTSAAASFDPILTMVSLLIAIGGCGIGFGLQAMMQGKAWPYLSGCITALGIASMHYLGMFAYQVNGIVEWSNAYVVASVVLSALFSSAAFIAFEQAPSSYRMASAVGLFVAGVISLHFTGMASLQVIPLSGAAAGNDAFEGLAVAVAGVGLLIIGTGLASYMIDARVSVDAHSRLQAFVKHAPASVAMFDRNMRYVAHTDRWLQDYLLSQESLVGLSHYDVFPEMPDHWKQKHQRILAGSVEKSDEEKFTRADGTEQTIRWEVRPWFSADGQIGGIMMLTEEISERKRIERELWDLAKLDALTSIPNRFHFEEHLEHSLERARADGAKLAVLGIDLDRFKEVNDHRGHKAGDSALKIIAQRLSDGLGPDEFVSRIGGDEFSAVKIYRKPDDLHDFINRIEARLAASMHIENFVIEIGGSVGVAVFPEDGKTSAELVSNADLAMYRAKTEVNRTTCFYEVAMDEAARERAFIAQELSQAIVRDEFQLNYQVQTNIETGERTGYEVLLRWRHPQRGLISPAQFIPIAEETGAIVDIGEWVLRSACREAASWSEKVKIAVNVSGVQLAQEDLAEVVHDILFQTGLPASLLELELTETSLIADTNRALTTIRRIRNLGVSIAIDDFGAGYSSLETLRSFPFDKIKLDRSFTRELARDPQSIAIVRAVLALGKSLGIGVLAEGVETKEQLAILRNEGCDEAQGYFIGMPTPEPLSNSVVIQSITKASA